MWLRPAGWEVVTSGAKGCHKREVEVWCLAIPSLYLFLAEFNLLLLSRVVIKMQGGLLLTLYLWLGLQCCGRPPSCRTCFTMVLVSLPLDAFPQRRGKNCTQRASTWTQCTQGMCTLICSLLFLKNFYGCHHEFCILASWEEWFWAMHLCLESNVFLSLFM